MTTLEMIEVMRAYVDGKKIECTDGMTGWQDCPNPIWCWGNLKYRIAKQTYWIDPVQNVVLSAWKEGAVLVKEVE